MYQFVCIFYVGATVYVCLGHLWRGIAWKLCKHQRGNVICPRSCKRHSHDSFLYCLANPCAHKIHTCMNTKEPIVMSTLNANLCIKKKKHTKASSSCPKMFCSQLIWVLEASTVERTLRKMDRNLDRDGKCNKKYKTIRRVRERLLKVETWEKDSELHSVLHIHCVQRYTLIHKLQP